MGTSVSNHIKANLTAVEIRNEKVSIQYLFRFPLSYKVREDMARNTGIFYIDGFPSQQNCRETLLIQNWLLGARLHTSCHPLPSRRSLDSIMRLLSVSDTQDVGYQTLCLSQSKIPWVGSIQVNFLAGLVSLP